MCLIRIDETGDRLAVNIQLAGDVPQTEFIYSVEMKDLLFFVHSDHVFELCFHKAKTPISMAPFSMIFLGEFSIAIYILWLEPYGIAGHMVYINPADGIDVSRIFNENGLYVNNLIEDEEYIAKSDDFTERDAGCNGRYALYSGNDVTLLLSAMYSEIEKLLDQPSHSRFYRWIGNINIAQSNNIRLKQKESLERGKMEIEKL